MDPNKTQPEASQGKPAHIVEVVIRLNRVTREISIHGPIDDAIFVKGLFHEALRVYDEQHGKKVVAPPV